ncbi:hypothetical protein K470DRAFT_202878, partial [Piedraia hortae CBS 480.64]
DTAQQSDSTKPQREDDAAYGYDFELKEQDRWLPIANGEYFSIFFSCSPCRWVVGWVVKEREEMPSPNQIKRSKMSMDNDANIHNFAPVARIMKTALPENAKISKEAKECMQECVSEFISFITSEASEKCQQEKRKTVNGEDIIFAMLSLGFENYSEIMKTYLMRYRE